ncbi:MAG: BspA family leucine-rich repeat surface protein, partial [Candidatus Neomarinimicrobiota bacterium]|nr:BspA family leucine-rich repeat surface protein [Candidatus Neomarinimicrobiota bacterium]
INTWDTSLITDMEELFFDDTYSGFYSEFNGDISSWDVSSVTNMYSMFRSADAFNQDLSSWDVSSVTDMSYMFYYADAFNGDISSWDVSNVTNMYGMFGYALIFNQDLSSWDVSSVTNMRDMFREADSFNQDLSSWDLSSVTYWMGNMFSGTDALSITNRCLIHTMWNYYDIWPYDWSSYCEMFSFQPQSKEEMKTAVNLLITDEQSARSEYGDIEAWDVALITDMANLFYNPELEDFYSEFNEDLSSWDVSSVTNMNSMFKNTTNFNHDISSWGVYDVTNMTSMFSGALNFNQDLSFWDISDVESMTDVFFNTPNLSIENKCAIDEIWRLNENWPHQEWSDCNGVCNGPSYMGDCPNTYELSFGNNLISIPGQLESTETIFFINEINLQCGDANNPNIVNFILGQGQGLFNTGDSWSGNLTTLNINSGYWVNLSRSCDLELPLVEYVNYCHMYGLGFGNNLISYTGVNNNQIIDALGGEEFSLENYDFILGQGQGLFNSGDSWSGNLNYLELGKGYWLNSYTNQVFNWGLECEELELLSKIEVDNFENNIPEEYRVNQSTEQGFYLIENIEITGHTLDENDLILAYNGNILTGSVEYNHDLIVLPVMGRDISEQTIGYIETGQKPILKLLKNSTGQIINLNIDLEPFRNLLVSNVQALSNNNMNMPSEYVMNSAYPNPFNPVTNISYGIPQDGEVSLNVYDLEGRNIILLDQGLKTAGNHNIEWNAQNYPSGIYFIKLTSKEFSQTQKVTLIK